MVIPCLYSFLLTVLHTPSAEPPINKKRTRTLFRKESGSSTNCMVGRAGYELRNSYYSLYHPVTCKKRVIAATSRVRTEIASVVHALNS